jgi:hypothetical protein
MTSAPLLFATQPQTLAFMYHRASTAAAITRTVSKLVIPNHLQQRASHSLTLVVLSTKLRYGEEGLKDGAGGGGFHDAGSIFEQFFGGGFGGGRAAKQQARKTEDIVFQVCCLGYREAFKRLIDFFFFVFFFFFIFQLPVELENLFTGKTRKLKVCD